MKNNPALSIVVAVVFILGIYAFRDAKGLRAKDYYMKQREQMVVRQIAERGIKDQRVLGALKKVERHLFVAKDLRGSAYEDHPLTIGYGQTISQPYIVAYMTEVLNLTPEDKVLEIGTGSGYQAAILAELAGEVYTIEIVKSLADSAKERLQDLGYTNIYVKYGDGYKGWIEHAPYDAVIVTAAPKSLPLELVNQLKPGGRMIVPIGDEFQQLQLITKEDEGYVMDRLLPVRFVPMIKGK